MLPIHYKIRPLTALQAAGNALQSIVEANEHGVEAIEAAEIEDVEALEAKRADVAKLLKAAKKSKSVFDAAVDAGREAAEAEIKAKQAATQKEQQRMTSAFTAGGCCWNGWRTYQECKPWTKRFADMDWASMSPEMQELKSGFDQHIRSAERGYAMGSKAFEDAQMASASEDAAAQMSVLREAVDIVEEANEFAEEAYKALLERIQALESSQTVSDAGAAAPAQMDSDSEDGTNEVSTAPAVDESVGDDIPPEDETPRGRLARLRRTRRGAAGARRQRSRSEDGGEERSGVSRSERLERLRRARRAEGDDEPRRPRRARGERPRRRRADADGEEASPRLRRRRPARTEDGATPSPRRARGDRSDRLSRLRGGGEDAPRRRRRPSAEDGERPYVRVEPDAERVRAAYVRDPDAGPHEQKAMTHRLLEEHVVFAAVAKLRRSQNLKTSLRY